MKKKIRVGIIFGGKSAEHEVSLLSAKNVIEALDKKKYEPVLIGIDKTGGWHLQPGQQYLLNSGDPKKVKLSQPKKDLNLNLKIVEVAFPVLHGTFGEDGTIQGLLKLMDVPFVGPGVLGSAVGMDKEVAKRLLSAAGIPTAKFVSFRNGEMPQFEKVKKLLGLPIFVKPANSGSSVGISKVKSKAEFSDAIKEAYRYDSKILIEQHISGREIEISVLGNEKPKASLPGEVVPTHEFYSYDAKYIDENGASLIVPAKLSKVQIKEIQKLAVKVFQTLELEGMARVDFFLKRNGKLYINEVNTIPGFTKISMYPKLWEVSGLPYPKLVDKLIELAIQRYQKEKKLKTNF